MTTVAPPRGLQVRAGTWHARRRPHSSPYRHAVKAMSTMGELAEALDYAAANPFVPSRNRRVVGAAVEVVVAMLVLIGRWWPDEDLLGAVAERLDQIEER